MALVRRVKYELPEGSWIGVLSDTHIPTRARAIPAVLLRVLDGAGLILHAGDLVDEDVLDELKVLAPVEAVAGNMDSPVMHRRFGVQKIVEVNSFKIGMIHGRRSMMDEGEWVYQAFSSCINELNAIIFGHSHCPYLKVKNDILLLNPGSPVEPRSSSRSSCARLKVINGMLEGEIIYI